MRWTTKSTKNKMLMLLIASCVLGAATGPIASSKLASPESLLAKSGSDGSKVVLTMVEKAKRLKAYSFDSQLITFTNSGKQVIETGKLYFKSPNLIRFEVLKAAKKSGAIVVRQPDGKIKGKMGGALSGIKVTLSPDSKLLKTANGFSVLESDLSSLLSLAKEKLPEGSCLVGTVNDLPVQIVEMADSNRNLVYRIALSSKERLPEEWNLFADDRLFSTVTISNLQVRDDLPDSLFTLAANDSESKSLDDQRLIETQILVDSLKRYENTGELSQQILQDVDRVLSLLQKESIALTNTPFENVEQIDSVKWAPGGLERLVMLATEIESMLDSLKPVGALVEYEERTALKDHSASQNWKDNLIFCKESVDDVLAVLNNEIPSAQQAHERVMRLQGQIAFLIDARKRINSGSTLQRQRIQVPPRIRACLKLPTIRLPLLLSLNLAEPCRKFQF